MPTTNATTPSTTTASSISLQENMRTTSSVDLSSSIFNSENSVSGVGAIIPSTIFPSDIKVSAGCLENNPMLTFTVDHHISISSTVSNYPAAEQSADSQVIFILALFLSSFLVAFAIIAVSIYLLHKMKTRHRNPSHDLSRKQYRKQVSVNNEAYQLLLCNSSQTKNNEHEYSDSQRNLSAPGQEFCGQQTTCIPIHHQM